MRIGRTRTRLGLIMAAAACLSCGAAPALAQGPYKQATPDPKLSKWGSIKTVSDERRTIESMLRGTSTLDEAQFDRFFNLVIFPQFTLAENIFATTTIKGAKNTVCKLPEMRKDFKNFFSREASNRQARDRLNQLTLKYMTSIAGDNYHPIARYNAMLLIADLNDDETNETPYKLALTTLVYAARSPKLIDPVRVAALIGIVRHAKAGIGPEMKELVTGVLTQLIAENKPPADRSREGHDWMRRRALEALAEMYVKAEPPADGSFLQLLNAVLQDKDSTMELRAEAAEALLTVKIVAPAKFDSAKMAAGIGQIAVDAYRQELSTRDQFGRKLSVDGMKYYFTLVQSALEKLDAAATSPKIKELQTSLNELVESATAEEDDPLGPPDPYKEEKLYDAIASNGAKFEADVTGKPLSEIMPKRAPVGGNAQAAAYGGGGRGYGAGGRPSTDRGGYGRPSPRGGYGAGGAR